MPSLIGFVFKGLLSAGKSAVKVAQGEGSFKENIDLGWGSFKEDIDLEWNGMGELQTRVVNFTAGDNGEGLEGLAIEIQGLIPVSRQMKFGLYDLHY